jgi:hypothetical protein
MIGASPSKFSATIRRFPSTDQKEALKMAVKQDRFRSSARMMLEPWLVEAALARLGERRLSPDEQSEIMRATRTSHRVRWPDWWEVETK